MTKLRWGVLGAARIATKKVIPAMQRGTYCEVTAIASRDDRRARETAGELAIPRAYGTYDDLLADPDIDAVYIPLPNHLHVPWSIRAAEAGKHVLCEKPIALTAEECRTLIAARDRTGVRIGEAFMVRTHPQWLRTRDLVRSGSLGPLRSVVSAFSYFNRDPANVRNVAEWGGGGLMDIGCYPVQISRFLFGEEPVGVYGAMEFDPDFDVDRLASGLLEFSSGHAVFTVGTQMTPWQRVQAICERGRVELIIPFNAPPDQPCRIAIDDGSDLSGASAQCEEFGVCDQYTIQGDAFSQAVLTGAELPTPLEDSLGNMLVLDRIASFARANAERHAARL